MGADCTALVSIGPRCTPIVRSIGLFGSLASASLGWQQLSRGAIERMANCILRSSFEFPSSLLFHVHRQD